MRIFVHPSTHPPTHSSFHPSIHPSNRPSIHPTIHPPLGQQYLLIMFHVLLGTGVSLGKETLGLLPSWTSQSSGVGAQTSWAPWVGCLKGLLICSFIPRSLAHSGSGLGCLEKLRAFQWHMSYS